jgi:hypothetical protein
MADDQASKIMKQIEYYLSDKNLVNDSFFHSKISAGKEGWVDLEFIMNCNKVKELSTDQEVIVKALEGSTEVECEKGML